jgi:LETM1 and EF-hand domain-containing protein 1
LQANTANQATAAELYDFMKRVRSGARVSNDDIKRFAKLFNDEITLDSVDRCVFIVLL